MTPVRSKRYRGVIHVTLDRDVRRTLCNRPCDGWIVEPDTAVTCAHCIRAERDIEEAKFN